MGLCGGVDGRKVAAEANEHDNLVALQSYSYDPEGCLTLLLYHESKPTLIRPQLLPFSATEEG